MYSAVANLKYLAGEFGTFKVSKPLPTNLTAREADISITNSYLDYYLGMNKIVNEDELVFSTVAAPPFLFINDRNESFDIYGPMLSLLMETARKLNYSVRGNIIQNEILPLDFSTHRPDVIVTLMWPLLTTVQELVAEQSLKGFNFERRLNMFGLPPLVELTKSLGVIRLDHILSVAQPIPRKLFSFLFMFEPFVWTALFTMLFFCTFVPNLILGKKEFSKTFWLFISAFITIPHVKKGWVAAKLLPLIMFLAFVLQALIGDEMLSAFTRNTEFEKAEMWDDLLDKNSDIYAINPDVFSRKEYENETKNNYFPKNTVYHEKFTPRLRLIPISVASNNRKMGEVLKRLSHKVDGVFMAPETLLRFGYNMFPAAEKDPNVRSHISKHGGDIQPYFLMTSHFANSNKKSMLNCMITATVESGIYEKWLATFVFGYMHSESESQSIVDYKKLLYDNIKGSVYLYFLGVIISCFGFFVECYKKLKNSRNSVLFIRRARNNYN